MFDFRKIQLSDRDWITEKLKISDFRGCEYSFANNCAWQRLSNTLICRAGEFYISCSDMEDSRVYVTFPTGVILDDNGKDKYLQLFSQLKRFFENSGKNLCIGSVTKENLEWLTEYYGNKITVKYDRDFSDYVYLSENLSELSGKKYHGKRNHIKRFCENDWSFEEISGENLDECIRFSADFYNKNSDISEHSAVVEQYAMNLFFMNMEYLGLKGGVLRQNGKIVGFTIGEKLNSDTFVVHIEKADSSVQGAYPTLCNQFAKLCTADFKYINREEDLGIEGLRKSKQSYHPAFLIDKYTLIFNEGSL